MYRRRTVAVRTPMATVILRKALSTPLRVSAEPTQERKNADTFFFATSRPPCPRPATTSADAVLDQLPGMAVPGRRQELVELLGPAYNALFPQPGHPSEHRRYRTAAAVNSSRA
jgi:hypothetical protein